LKSRTFLAALIFSAASYSQESIADTDPQAAPPAAPVAAPAPVPAERSTKLEELPELADWHVRAKEMGHQLIGAQAVFEVLPGTISDHARNFPKEWTRSFGGLGKRFASQYGQFLVSETVEFGVSALHHEDPRYYRMPNASVSRRIGHSIASAFIAQKADGTGSTIALSRFAGVYGSWFVAQHWEPNSATGVGQFMLWGTVGMFTKTFANTFHEFWPDAKKKFFTRGGH